MNWFEALDPKKLKALERAWAEQETWFQLDHSRPEEHSWPVPGSWEAAQEGKAAYYMYRDAFVPWMEWLQSTDDVLSDLVRLYQAANALDAAAMDEVGRNLFDENSTFARQWHNLFGNPFWSGVSHESLSLYARKFEVEWPLLLIAALADIVNRRDLDLRQSRFHDRRGRLQKGRLIANLMSGLREYPALENAVRVGYDADLRNLISHNSYSIAEGKLFAIDGSLSRSEKELYRQVQLLQAVQNGLLWIKNEVTRDVDPALHSKGIVVVGWLPMTEATPRAIVAQLAPFQRLDTTAAWLDEARIWFEDEKMMTRFGTGRPRGGIVFPTLGAVLDAIRTGGKVLVELVPVMPCFHFDSYDHFTLPTANDIYCVAGDVVTREIRGIIEEKA